MFMIVLFTTHYNSVKIELHISSSESEYSLAIYHVAVRSRKFNLGVYKKPESLY